MSKIGDAEDIFSEAQSYIECVRPSDGSEPNLSTPCLRRMCPESGQIGGPWFVASGRPSPAFRRSRAPLQ
jgi:hypothetical protein